jgi:hypothetical protein
MTIAGPVENHQERCLPHLLTLRMMARGEAGLVLTWQTVADIIQATGAVLAEAKAAGDDVRAAAGLRDLGAGTFLQVRQDRLAVAAGNAIAAAEAGDSGQLRSQLRRFEVLTEAIWTVQQAVYGSARKVIWPPEAGIAALPPVAVTG